MPMYVHDPKNRMAYDNGAIGYRSPAPFSSWARIENCPCDDNVRRLVYVTGQPRDAFSVPAAVRVKGKWVSGFVSFGNETDDAKGGPCFIATGKNKDLIANARKFAKALLEG